MTNLELNKICYKEHREEAPTVWTHYAGWRTTGN